MATARRQRTDPVSAAPPFPPAPPPETPLERRQAQERAGEGVGLFAVLRMLERRGADKPRIGRNARLREALVRLGQDPFLAFPTQDVARVDMAARPPALRAQFLGFFGAFGALPLNWTEEVRRWFDSGDESFTAFTDIFAVRFQELFFRAWSDAHPITQFDHPDDHFIAYLLALGGSGTRAFRHRDGLPDAAKARLAPLASGRVKSPVRLRQMLQLHFGRDIRVQVEELVPSWLEFEPDARARLGQRCATLGRDLHLGRGQVSVGEKIRLHFHLPSIAVYDRFIPGGTDHAALRDIVFWYLGQRFEIEVVLWLPRPEILPTVLGTAGRLGWMACLQPDRGGPNEALRSTSYRLQPQSQDIE